MPKRIALVVAYDGAGYSGFTRQANARAVVHDLEAAIGEMDPAASPVGCASRTDAGVHARGQVVVFDTERDIEPRGWVLGLARFLPPEIAVTRAARAPLGFEPRRDATLKQYRYELLRSQLRDPFFERRAWRIVEPLDVEKMQTEARALLGEHDFRAFRSSADQRENTVRSIRRAQIDEVPDEVRRLSFVIEGNRFLHRMVRIIVGTLIDVGRGRLESGAIKRAIASGNRTDLGMTAPPDGLYLEWVELNQPLADEWPPHG